ncbi:hypothetical protein [Tenacibaculum crassostreae]|uniref:hypothetical protein n=1 Tax=Tenacibaculum crassostreae TaxID=502683 RepID=UPI003895501E
MKFKLLLTILLISSITDAQQETLVKPLGIGKVKLQIEDIIYSKTIKQYELEFFEKEDCLNSSNKVEFKWNKNGLGYMEVLNSDFIKIKDWHVEEPYFIVNFICLEKNSKGYKIIVNEETNESRWIKKSPKMEFQPWSDFLRNLYCVEQIDINSNPLLNKVNGKPINKEKQCWKVLKISEEWILVNNQTDEPLPNNEKPLKEIKGWIKWRNKNGLLIDYYLVY